MNKDTRTAILFTVFQIILIAAAFGLGVVISQLSGKYSQAELPILNEAFSILQQNSLYDPPAEPALEYGMIQGMVQASGDPYSAFVEPVQAELQSDQLTGKFGGIGAKIQPGSDGFFYLIPYDDSPAKDAGINENDRLLAIDDVLVNSESTTDQIAALIRGPEGTKVKLLISEYPEYQRQVEYSIKRREFSLPSIEYFLSPNYANVGILQINIIAESTPDELINAISDLQTRGASYFVIDLRNNGGGLLDSGTELAKLFLPKTSVILQQQAKNTAIETISATKDGIFTSLDVVFLVNGNTASAAEIFAGALQANHRCLLVGQKTYGKNTIQLVFTLQDSSSLRVTSAEWWFPALPLFTSGNGLQPDIEKADIDSMDPAILDAAIQALLDS